MRVFTKEQRQASTDRVTAWRRKQLELDPEGYRRKNAEGSKRRYHVNPSIAVKQQQNFKRAYDENPEFRAKIVRASSTGRYRMTPKQYEDKLALQGGHCALCSSTSGDTDKHRLHIDHDHACCDNRPRTCGRCNRGILCGHCNRKLGALEETLKEASVHPVPGTWTEKALAYLRSYSQVKAAAV